MSSTPVRIDIVSADDRFAGAAVGVLEHGGYAVTRHAAWAAFQANGKDAKLCVVDAAPLTDQEFQQLEARMAQGLAVVCATSDDDATIEVLRRRQAVCSILSKKEAYEPQELLTTVTELLTRHAAGIEQFLEPGDDIRSEQLTSYAEKEATFERVHEYVAGLPCFPDFPEVVVSVVWELLMNALIDAPASPRQPDAAATPEIDRHVVELQYGSDKSHFAVAVVDKFGALTRDKVVEALERCHRRGPDQIKSGPNGAGIGLYLIFSYASHLHFSVRPGACTKVMLLTRLSRRYKEFSNQKRSINFLIEE